MGKGKEEGFWGSALKTDTGVVSLHCLHTAQTGCSRSRQWERMHQELSLLTKGPQERMIEQQRTQL